MHAIDRENEAKIGLEETVDYALWEKPLPLSEGGSMGMTVAISIAPGRIPCFVLCMHVHSP